MCRLRFFSNFPKRLYSIASSNFQLKAFGTIQETMLTNYLDRDPNASLVAVLQDKYNETALSGTDPNPLANYLYSQVLSQFGISPSNLGLVSDDFKDMEHKTTPKFSGGIIANYTPIKNLNLNANVYFLSKQEFIFQFENDLVDSKTIVNLKADYRIWENNSIYFNARNFLGNDSHEFMFMDRIGSQYLLGVNINF